MEEERRVLLEVIVLTRVSLEKLEKIKSLECRDERGKVVALLVVQNPTDLEVEQI